MPYGEIRVDTITFTNAGVDKSITVSGLFASTSGNLTVTGTVSGTTFTGTTANFTSGNVTTFSGGACTITSGVFASGTATNPSISFIADSNTGLYSPGADQFAIATNSTGRLFVDAGGNIGVGTSSPFSSNGTNLHVLSTGTARLWLQSTAASTGRQFYLESLSTGGLTFSDGTAGQERMRLDSSGRVGVGTSSPQATLHVETVGNPEVLIGGTQTPIFSLIGGTGSEPVIGFAKGSLRIATVTGAAGAGFSEKVRIDPSGRVGIGTSSPLTKLEVRSGVITAGSVDAPNGAEILRGYYGSSGALAVIGSEYSSGGPVIGCGVKPSTSAAGAFLSSTSIPVERGAYTIQGNIHKWFAGASQTVAENSSVSTSEVMRIDSGRLGIGNTVPLAAIDVTGTNLPLIVQSINATSNYITHRHHSSGDIAYIGAGNGAAISSGTASDYAIRANLGALLFATNGNNERARIDSSGRLLVGTSTALNVEPFVSAQVHNEARYGYASIYRANDASGPALYFIKSRAASAATVVQSGDVLGEIRFQGADGGDYETPGGTIKCEVDGTPGANDMPGRLVFSTTADGASSPTERMRITSGGYIKASNTGSYTDAGGGSRATNAQHFFRSDQNGLTIQATNTNLNSAVEGFTSDFATGATGNHFIGAIDLGRVFIVAANGNVTNTNNIYGAISDVKLKANIVDANSQWDDLKALQVRNYNLKEGQTHTQIGIIAQEAELVSPGLVSESPDLDAEGNELGTVTKSVNYSVLYMKAIKALQEAMERIETLEAKVAALEAS